MFCSEGVSLCRLCCKWCESAGPGEAASVSIADGADDDDADPLSLSFGFGFIKLSREPSFLHILFLLFSLLAVPDSWCLM